MQYIKKSVLTEGKYHISYNITLRIRNIFIKLLFKQIHFSNSQAALLSKNINLALGCFIEILLE